MKRYGALLLATLLWYSQTAIAASSTVAKEVTTSPMVDPEGVSAQLRILRNRETIAGPLLPQRYYDWKTRLRRNNDLTVGLSSYVVSQLASEEGSGDDDSSMGGIYRLQGAWKLLNPSSVDSGRIEFRVEYRTSHFGGTSPTELSRELGIAANGTGFLYNDDFDLDLSVLSWTQIFNQGRAGIAVGRLPFDAYQDAFLLQTVNGNFLNNAFVLNPALPITGIGALGVVAKGMISKQLWIGAQAYDANAENGEFDFDTVQENEWQKNVEIGWTPSLERRKWDRIQFTYWHKDKRRDSDVESGHGWAVTGSKQFSPQLFGFARYGHSDGGAGVSARNSASVGVRLAPRGYSLWSLGLGWSEPSDKRLDDEYVVETSFRLHVTPEFSVMPDLQWVIDPAENPDEDSIVVFSLRMTLSL